MFVCSATHLLIRNHSFFGVGFSRPLLGCFEIIGARINDGGGFRGQPMRATPFPLGNPFRWMPHLSGGFWSSNWFPSGSPPSAPGSAAFSGFATLKNSNMPKWRTALA